MPEQHFFVPLLEQSFPFLVHERDHYSLPRTSPGRPKGAYLNPASAGFFLDFHPDWLFLDALPRDWLESVPAGAAAEGLLLNTVGRIILGVFIVLDAPAAQSIKAGSKDYEDGDKRH